MSEWFYARGGQQSGPVTFDQLKELADEHDETGIMFDEFDNFLRNGA